MDANVIGLIIPVVVVVGGVLAVIVLAISNDACKKSETREREETRREVAAYVAEGSMTPEDGERLLQAGRKA